MSAPRCSVEGGALRIEWVDRTIALSGELLRRSCRCAGCRSLQLHGVNPDGGGVAVSGFAPMGYGVQLRFSDGHDKGVFPWAYLAEIAQRP